MDAKNRETLDAIKDLIDGISPEMDVADQIGEEDQARELISEIDDKEAIALAADALIQRSKARHPSSIPLDESEMRAIEEPELTEEQKTQNSLGRAFGYWHRQHNLANREGNRNGAINQTNEALAEFINLMENVKGNDERDKLVRQLYSTLDPQRQDDFVPFINGVINEIVLKEELEIAVASFAGTRPDVTVAVRKSSREEDVEQGFDFMVSVVGEDASEEIRFDAKSRSQFRAMQGNGTVKATAGDSTYMGKKGSGVIVVSPEGSRGAHSTILQDNEVTTRAMEHHGESQFVPSFERKTTNLEAFRSALEEQIDSEVRKPEPSLS